MARLSYLFLASSEASAFRFLRQQPLYTQCRLPDKFPTNAELPKDDTRDSSFDEGAKLALVCQEGFVVEDPDVGAPSLECTPDGYFAVKGGSCIKKPHCVPPMDVVMNAKFTGDIDNVHGARYKCDEGFSTDGQDGGTYGQGNIYFNLRCNIVEGMYDYSDIDNKCKPVQMALTKTFTTIFDVLFGVNCENGVLNPGEMGLGPKVNSGPAFADFVCAKISDAAEKGICDAAKGTLESSLKSNWDGRKDAAKAFCDTVWKDVVEDEIPEKHKSDYEG